MSRSTLRHLIIASLTVLVAIGGYSFMAYTITKEAATLRTHITAVEKERAQESVFYRLEKVAEDSAASRATIASYFLGQAGESIDVLTTVEALAPKVGVLLETQNLREVADEATKTNWIEVDFAFSGSRASVENFIEVLEHLPYASHIRGISISGKGNLWEAEVTLRVLIMSYDG